MLLLMPVTVVTAVLALRGDGTGFSTGSAGLAQSAADMLGVWLAGAMVRQADLRLVADCEAGRFALVVEEDRLHDIPGIDACLDRRYELQARLGPYDLFRPRPAEAP